MVRRICKNNSGYGFKAGVKITSRAQTKALVRIKEKMLAKPFASALEKGNQATEADTKEEKYDKRVLREQR